MRDEFRVHLLNKQGIQRAGRIADLFSLFLNDLEDQIGTAGREAAIVRTKLEEAAFFAKKAMAIRTENQA